MAASHDGAATALGLSLGEFDPTAIILGAYLQFVRHGGADVDASIRGQDEIRDNVITGTRTLASLLHINVTRRVQTADALTERAVEDYPMPTLREAIMNALVHRAYDVPTRRCASSGSMTGLR